MRKFVLVLLSLCIVSSGALKAPRKEERKQLAGPPSEFKTMAMPSLEKTALESGYTMIDFVLQSDSTGNEYTWEGSYSIDAHDTFKTALISPHLDSLELYVKPPHFDDFYLINSEFFDTAEVRGFQSEGPFGIDGNMKPAKTFVFYDIEAGDYEIRIKSTGPVSHITNVADGVFILNSYSTYKLFSHINTFELEEGQSVGIVAQMFDESDPSWETGMEGRPAPLQNVIKSAEMEVLLPNGKEVEVTMKDDGLTGYDLEADDGIYAATITTLEEGSYIYRIKITGETPEGYGFSRTTTHLVQIVLPQLTFSGLASQTYDPKTEIVSFHVNVDLIEDERLNRDEEGLTVLAYAQVWGMDASGLHYIPIAWVEAMVDPVNKDSEIVLELNEKWIHLAGASLPFQLRDVSMMDRNTFGVLSERPTIFVKSDSDDLKLVKRIMMGQKLGWKDTIEIDEKMMNGVRPEKYRKLNITQKKNADSKEGVLLLVHGYCSSSVWDEAQFANSIEFPDYKQSRTNDEFANRILEFAEAQGAESYSLLGHSQGGMAITHLYSFYWSGADMIDASSGYLLQSVGTPYQGCSIAGGLADVGSIFGAGCGSNYDLSVAGATVWVQKIPTSKQSAVYYYTTTYGLKWYNSNCVTGTSIVLKAPNDGTTELPYAPLPYANSMGNKESWCHATDMKYPAQYTDATRNAKISADAARKLA